MKDKFQGSPDVRSPDVLKELCGSSSDGHPIIFRWSNLKGGSINLMELFN